MTLSPCIKLCVMDGDLCAGCGRTLAEIAGWGSLSDGARRAIMAELPTRMTRRAEQTSPAGFTGEPFPRSAPT